jgi:hypothetical protein
MRSMDGTAISCRTSKEPTMPRGSQRRPTALVTGIIECSVGVDALERKKNATALVLAVALVLMK